MPELAEVETVRNVLKEEILNKRIENVLINYPNIVENDLNYFKNNLIGNKFIDIKRKGKWLIFELENYYLLSHLRMEGKYFIKDINSEMSKHEHIIFRFNNFDLRYADTRKFGRMQLIDKDKLDECLSSLGIDGISNDLTKEYLYEKIKKINKPIKSVLLDQSIIAGIGNIYADEILFTSSIHPLTISHNLSLEDCENIVNSTKTILNKAIKYGGTTIKSYTSSLGVTGSYQNYLLVHTKEICPKCQSNIQKIKVGGRTTYYCNNCQIKK